MIRQGSVKAIFLGWLLITIRLPLMYTHRLIFYGFPYDHQYFLPLSPVDKI